MDGDSVNVLGLGALGGSLLVGIILWLIQRTDRKTTTGESRSIGKLLSSMDDIKALLTNANRLVMIMHEWMSPNTDGVQAWRSPEVLTLLHSIETNQKKIIDELQAIRRQLER